MVKFVALLPRACDYPYRAMGLLLHYIAAALASNAAFFQGPQGALH